MGEMQAQAERFGAELLQEEVTSVDLRSQPFRVRTPGQEHLTRALILATGASARLLGLPSERQLMGRGVSTCATCDGYFFRDREIAVVGGGDTAVEEAIFLTKFASKVTLIHRRDQLRASKIMQEKAFANPKITFRWNTLVDEVKDVDKGEVSALVLRDKVTGEVSELPVQALFVAIGHTPNTSLFAGQIEMDEGGYLVTRDKTMTSVPGVFACGDVQDHVHRQAVTAAGRRMADRRGTVSGEPQVGSGPSQWRGRLARGRLSRSTLRQPPHRRRRGQLPGRE
jgi:thioredoxin reductase (NADPH)